MSSILTNQVSHLIYVKVYPTILLQNKINQFLDLKCRNIWLTVGVMV